MDLPNLSAAIDRAGPAPDDGGPAFSGIADSAGLLVRPYSGMSLRDYFAAQAVAGLYFASIQNVAGRAYELADAMIAERNRLNGR